jgi:hypothetical protein
MFGLSESADHDTCCGVQRPDFAATCWACYWVGTLVGCLGGVQQLWGGAQAPTWPDVGQLPVSHALVLL